MSEPNSGSDLASVRTKAERVADGWLVNGTKIWTTNAHRADYMIALLRTDLSAVAAVAAGARFGAVGTSSTLRHIWPSKGGGRSPGADGYPRSRQFSSASERRT